MSEPLKIAEGANLLARLRLPEDDNAGTLLARAITPAQGDNVELMLRSASRVAHDRCADHADRLGPLADSALHPITAHTLEVRPQNACAKVRLGGCPGRGDVALLEEDVEGLDDDLAEAHDRIRNRVGRALLSERILRAVKESGREQDFERMLQPAAVAGHHAADLRTRMGAACDSRQNGVVGLLVGDARILAEQVVLLVEERVSGVEGRSRQPRREPPHRRRRILFDERAVPGRTAEHRIDMECDCRISDPPVLRSQAEAEGSDHHVQLRPAVQRLGAC